MTVIPATLEVEAEGSQVRGQSGQNQQDPISITKYKQKRAWLKWQSVCLHCSRIWFHLQHHKEKKNGLVEWLRW
jgi:hypothetical protein